MPKEKDRTLNPALAHHRSEKAKSIKKSKTTLQTQRNEKLARRNPDRLQRQIDELKAVEARGEVLRPRDKQVLEGLERDLRAVRKAREVVGDRAPQFASASRKGADGEERRSTGDGRGGSALGKRRRGTDMQREEDDESSATTDEEVRSIPMPRDTPPPIPRRPYRHSSTSYRPSDGESRTQPHALPAKPPLAVTQTTYSAAPQVRNLIQEATSKFVPTAVLAAKNMRGQGQAGRARLMEPEEADAMEAQRAEAEAEPQPRRDAEHDGDGWRYETMQRHAGPDGLDADAIARLQEEEERFQREIQGVEMDDAAGIVDTGTDADLNADEHRHALAREAMRDAEKAADAAEEEAQHFMMEQEVARGLGEVTELDEGREGWSKYEARQAEEALRGVEVEEVEDEDL